MWLGPGHWFGRLLWFGGGLGLRLFGLGGLLEGLGLGLPAKTLNERDGFVR